MKNDEILDNEELSDSTESNNDNSEKDIHEGSWLKSVIKNGKWYLMGSFATKGMLFFMLPIYLEYMTPSEYGIFNTLNSIAQLLPIFISFSLDAAFGRFFHDYKKNPEKLSRLFSTVYWFVLFYGVFMLAIMVSTSRFWITSIAEVPAYPYALLAFLPPLFLQLGMLGIVFLKQSLKSKLTSIIEASSTVVNILITVPLLVIWDLDVIARLWGYVGAAAFIFFFMTYYFRKEGILKWTFDRVLLRIALLYSIPLIPSVASKWINMLSDRLVIAVYIDQEAVGLYSLAANIAIILMIIQNSISEVLKPVSISGLVYDKEQTKLKMADFSLLLWVIMLLANFGAVLFAKDAVTLLAPDSYKAAYIYIPILGFVYVLGAQYRIFNYVIQFHKKTWIITIATLLSAGGNLLFNLLLVPKYGVIAAPFATVLASVILLSVIMFYAQRMDRIALHWRKLAAVLATYLVGLFICLQYFFAAEVTFLNFILKGILFLGIAGICVWIGDYYQGGVKYLRENVPFLKS